MKKVNKIKEDIKSKADFEEVFLETIYDLDKFRELEMRAF
jgi:hypothetical protein